MAKGNLLLGYGRGKVGSLVFSRRKGEQIVRARNTAPANPRTNAQLTQRMKMYAPVKLYRQSMERFFKYAFPVKEKETIFNAFMRENISIAPWTARELAVAQAPIPFPARMSAGGISGIPMQSVASFSDDALDGNFYLGLNSDNRVSAVFAMDSDSTAANLTLGEFSAAVIARYPQVMNGDQLTFVAISTDALSLEGINVVYDGTGSFNFSYKKVIVNTESTDKVASLGLYAADGENGLILVGVAGLLGNGTECSAGCVIVTRSVGSGVDASNTNLVLNAPAVAIYDTMKSNGYRQFAAMSYKASPDAYLNPATTTNE